MDSRLIGQIFLVEVPPTGGKRCYAVGGMLERSALPGDAIDQDTKFVCKLDATAKTLRLVGENRECDQRLSSSEFKFYTLSDLLKAQIWQRVTNGHDGYFEIVARTSSMHSANGESIAIFAGPLLTTSEIKLSNMAVYDLHTNGSNASVEQELSLHETQYRVKFGDAFNGHFANPFFGTTEPRAGLLSTLPLAAQQAIQRHGLLSHGLANESRPNELSELREILKAQGLYKSNEDQDYLKFRSEMLSRADLKPIFEPHTAADIEHRDKVGSEVIRSILLGEPAVAASP